MNNQLDLVVLKYSSNLHQMCIRDSRNATVQMAVVPMLCGSSFKNKGVQTLLDYVCAFLPSRCV